VFIVYRVLTYKSGGLIFSHATGMSGSYGFGTYQQGQADRIGMAASSGGSFAGADAPYDSWHVANVYFGSSDGFLSIDDGASVTTFATSGQYTADALTNVQIGGAVFGGHDVPNLIGEVLIFDEKLSDDNRAFVTTALMSKWDLLDTRERRWRWARSGKFVSSDAASYDYFGRAVAVSGDTVVVGIPRSGSAYVFVRADGDWTQQAKLTASDAASDDSFGQAVAISGDTIVVGAPRDDDNSQNESGSAYIFVRSAGDWNQQAKLTASDAARSDYFGQAVAISGDTVVVGAPYDDDNNQYDSGSAYIFVRSADDWNQQAKLTASDAAWEDNFGQAVAISGDTVVVGAPRDDDNNQYDRGSASVFKRSGNMQWVRTNTLTASSDAAANDNFGTCVAVSGENMVVGAPNADHDDGSDSGVAYAFSLVA